MRGVYKKDNFVLMLVIVLLAGAMTLLIDKNYDNVGFGTRVAMPENINIGDPSNTDLIDETVQDPQDPLEIDPITDDDTIDESDISGDFLNIDSGTPPSKQVDDTADDATGENPNILASACNDGDTQSCNIDGALGICSQGMQTCNAGEWQECLANQQPKKEICGNNIDENCDGMDVECEEYSLTISPGQKIVLLGDSNTAIDWPLAESDKWPQRVAAGLPGVTVINRGVGGTTTSAFINPTTPPGYPGSMIQWKADAGNYYIITFGLNEIFYGVSLAQFEADTRQLIAEVRSIGATPILMTNTYLDAPLHWRATDSMGASIVQYDNVKRALSTELNVPLIDVYNRIQQEAATGNWDVRIRNTRDPYVLDNSQDYLHPNDPTWFEDVHYNANGCAIVADEIINYFNTENTVQESLPSGWEYTPGLYGVTSFCSNNVTDTFEEGVDCGGPCTACAIPQGAIVYYVSSSSGNDAWDGRAPSWNGTSGPWQTLTKVNNNWNLINGPGRHLLFKRGDSWTSGGGSAGFLQPNNHLVGSAANPIVIGAYGTGAKPIIGDSSQSGKFGVITGAHTNSRWEYVTLQDINFKNEVGLWAYNGNMHHVRVLRLLVEKGGIALFKNPSNEPSPETWTFDGNSEVNYCEVAYNEVRESGADGINVYGNNGNWVHHNEIYTSYEDNIDMVGNNLRMEYNIGSWSFHTGMKIMPHYNGGENNTVRGNLILQGNFGGGNGVGPGLNFPMSKNTKIYDNTVAVTGFGQIYGWQELAPLASTHNGTRGSFDNNEIYNNVIVGTTYLYTAGSYSFTYKNGATRTGYRQNPPWVNTTFHDNFYQVESQYTDLFYIRNYTGTGTWSGPEVIRYAYNSNYVASNIRPNQIDSSWNSLPNVYNEQVGDPMFVDPYYGGEGVVGCASYDYSCNPPNGCWRCPYEISSDFGNFRIQPGSPAYGKGAYAAVDNDGTVPNAPPNVLITYPSNNANFNNGSTIQINATASDSDGTITSVSFYRNGTLIGTDSSNPYSTSAWTNAQVGSYSITAVATDNSSESTTSSAVNVNVRDPSYNSPPTVSIIYPFDGQTFNNGSTITVNATAFDSDGFIVRVEFFRDGILLFNDTSAPYSTTNVWTNAQVGSYSLTARAIDNRSAVVTSSAVTVYVSVPGVDYSPTVNLVSPANGASGVSSPVSFGSSVSDDKNVLSATLYNNEGGSWTLREARWNGETPYNSTGLMLLYHFNNEALFGETSTSMYDFSRNNRLGTAYNGAVVGSAGKFGSGISFDGVNDYAGTGSFNVGSSWTINLWVNPRRLVSNGAVLWAPNGNQPWSENNIGGLYASNSDIHWWFGGSQRISAPVLNTNTWSMVTMTSDGSTVRLYTNGVQVGTSSVSTNFNNPLVIAQKGIDNDEAYFNGTMDELAVWNRALSASEVSNIYSYTKTSFSPIFQPRTLALGTYAWNVLATDNVSNSAWALNNYTFTVGGTVSNTPPSVAISYPSNSQTFNNGSTITVNATATDDGSVVRVEFFRNNTLISNDTVFPYSTGNAWTNAAAGSYRLTARAVDNNGSATVSSAIDITVQSTGGQQTGSTLYYDNFNGSINTPLATYDSRYKNARTNGYDVANLLLDGQGGVKMNGAYNGGFSFEDPSVNANNTQTSQITLLAKSAGDPILVRLLVQTLSTGEEYYGWELQDISGGKYNSLVWYNGVQAIQRTYPALGYSLDISSYNLYVSQDIVMRTTITYTSPTEAVVSAYAGVSGSPLQLLDSFTVRSNGNYFFGGVQGGYNLPFLTNRYPGMLYHENSAGSTRSLFKEFYYGTSTNTTNTTSNSTPNTPPSVSILNPVAGNNYAYGSFISINATASDSDGISRVEFYANNVLLNVDSSYPYYYTWMNASSGTYQLYARAYDVLNASTNSSIVSITVASPPVVNGTVLLPEVTIEAESGVIVSPMQIGVGSGETYVFSPVGNSTGGWNGSVSFTFNVTIPGTYYVETRVLGASGSSDSFFVGFDNEPARNNNVYAYDVAQDTSFVWDMVNRRGTGWDGQNHDFDPMYWNFSVGLHTLNFYGREPNAQLDKVVLRRVVPPNILPSVSVSYPTQNLRFNPGSNIVVNATAVDSDGTISLVEFFANNNLIGSTSSSPYSISWNNVPVGIYSLTASATDNSGGVSTSNAVNVYAQNPSVCGNTVCEYDETCNSCSGDCGVCAPLAVGWSYTPGLAGVTSLCSNGIKDPFEDTADKGGPCGYNYPADLPNPLPAGVDVFYISNNGNDNNDGRSPTQGAGTSGPWATLNKLHDSWNLIGPGDYVLFERGDVWRPSSYPGGSGLIDPPFNKSGAPNAYITIGAYGTGARPIISARAAPTINDGGRFIMSLDSNNGLNYFVFQDMEFRGTFWFRGQGTTGSASQSPPYTNLKFLRNKFEGNAPGDATNMSIWFEATREIPTTYNPETYFNLGQINNIEFGYNIFNNSIGADTLGLSGQGYNWIHHNEIYNSRISTEANEGESIDISEGNYNKIEYNIISGSGGYNLKIQKHGNTEDYCVVRGNLFMGASLYSDGASPMTMIGVRWCNIEDNTFVMNLGGDWSWNAGYDGHVNPVLYPDTMSEYGIYGNFMKNNIFYGRHPHMFAAKTMRFTFRNGSTQTFSYNDIWMNNRFENNTYWNYQFSDGSIHVREYVSPSGFQWVTNRPENGNYDQNSGAYTTSGGGSDYYITSSDFNSRWLSKPNVIGDRMENPNLINPYWTNAWNYGNYRVQNTSPSYGRGAWAAVDRVGGTSTPTPNAAPSVSIVYPSNNAVFVSGNSIIINATASDSDGTITRVDFFRNGTVISNDTTSPYQATWTNPAVGSYVLTAKAYDNNGSNTTSSPVYVTISSTIPNTPPNVAITYPLNNANFTNGSTIIVNASANDPDVGGSIVRVEFFRNNTLLLNDTVFPYSTGNAWTNAAAGSYRLTARAVDNTGSATVSSPVDVVVYAPSSPVVNGDSYNVYIPSVDFVNNNVLEFDVFITSNNLSNLFAYQFALGFNQSIRGAGTLTFEYVAGSSQFTSIPPSVAIGVQTGDGVQELSFASSVGNEVLSSSPKKIGRFRLTNTANFASFNHGISFNFAGSVNTIIMSGIIPNTYDATNQGVFNVYPRASITYPLNNANFTNGSTIIVNASAYDSDGTISRVEFFRNNTLLLNDTVFPYSTGNAWTNAAVGSYRLTARAVDNNGSATVSSSIDITVQSTVVASNTIPNVAITYPLNNANFTNGSTITVNATAFDSDVGGSIVRVEFFRNGTLLFNDTSAPYSTANTWTNAQVGSYSLTARAVDNNGGVNTSNAIIVNVNAPTVAPTVSITYPVNGQTFANTSNITINASVVSGTAIVSRVDFYRNNTFISNDITSPYQATLTNAQTGTYALTARVFDTGGLNSTSSQVIITINSTPIIPNTAPTVSITYPFNGQTLHNGSTITINATAIDSDGNVTRVDFYRNNTFINNDTTIPYQATWTNPLVGSYSLTARAFDDDGANTTSTIFVTIQPPYQNIPPTISIDYPLNNSQFLNGTTIQINATATDTDGNVTNVIFYRNGTLIESDNSNPYSTSAWTNAQVGSYSLTARAFDNNGSNTTSRIVNVNVLSCMPGDIRSCSNGPGICSGGTQTCSAIGTWSLCNAPMPGSQAEICGNDIDEDCDGVQNNECSGFCDTDGDGHNQEELLWCIIFGPVDDCDDNNPSINPEMPEICGNSIDENCDGEADSCPVAATCQVSSIVEVLNMQNQHVTNNTIYYNNVSAGSFDVRVDVFGSNIQYVLFPDTTSIGTNDTTMSYSHVYSWDTLSVFSGRANVSVYSAGGLNTCAFNVIKDTSSPNGGSILYPGQNISGNFAIITYSSGIDAQSGLNPSSGILERQQCFNCTITSAWSSWNTVDTGISGIYTDESLQNDTCYKYRYLISDNVGNSVIYDSSNVLCVIPDFVPTLIINNTNMTETNYSVNNSGNISNMTLRNAHGKIHFLGNIRFYRDLLLNDQNIQITNHRIYIDSIELPEFNEEAELEFYGLTYVNPNIYRDGVLCGVECYNKNYDSTNGVYYVIVSGFSEYSLQEGEYCGDGVCSSTEVCDVCEADCGECDTSGSGGGSGRGGGGGSGYVPPAIVQNNSTNRTNTSNSNISIPKEQAVEPDITPEQPDNSITENPDDITKIEPEKIPTLSILLGIILIGLIALLIIFLSKKPPVHPDNASGQGGVLPVSKSSQSPVKQSSQLSSAQSSSSTQSLQSSQLSKSSQTLQQSSSSADKAAALARSQEMWNKCFDYVNKMRERKYTDAQIREQLKKSKWSDAQIDMLFKRMK
ncbi:MAG: Ig-like domain-containing protein [Candidatus Woesearchaeota archaeon]